MDAIYIIEQIKQISDRRISDRTERQKRGEFFNIFSDLNMMSDEVHLHSALLATLLNPYGSHGQKSVFLELFVSMVFQKIREAIWDFDWNMMTVEVEKNIGVVDEDTGGRIDLYITDGKHQIIIENKIYASDQDYQMKRYWNYATSRVPAKPFKLIYLTLDGHHPSQKSLGDLRESDYLCLSYKTDIVHWLDECVSKTKDVAPVRETIKQYIRTINILTDNGMEKDVLMEKEMLQELGKQENIDAVFDIYESRNDLINYIINERFLPKLKELAENKGFQMLDIQKNWMEEAWAGLSFLKKEWKYFKLSFEFEQCPIGNLIFGFQKHDAKVFVESEQKLIERYAPYAVSNGWIYKGFEGHRYWNNREAIRDLLNGKTLRIFERMFDEAIVCAKGLDV